MLKRLWSLPLEQPPRGMALAREANRLAAWDDHWLFWTNHTGQRQAQARFSDPLIAVAAAEDGSAFAATCGDGRICWLAPDLRPRWEKMLGVSPTAAALDPLGIVLAVGDARGKLHLFDSGGGPIREWECPRPVKFLTFDPTSGRLIAAADLGWVAAFDAAQAEPVWRDTPVVNIAGLAATVSGDRIALACFSDGLRLYRHGKLQKPEMSVPPCRLMAINHDGTRLVVSGLDGTLLGFAGKGGSVFTHKPSSAPIALALSALGETLYVAAADKIKALDLREGWEAAQVR